MRPIRLEIEGLTCFREKQIVDFTKLDLFAIAGPTGSGKTSILDAIVYALYGKVPRMGKQGLTELISAGHTRVSVLFDFSFGGREFRITRRANRTSTPPKAQIECDGKPIEDSVRRVDAYVEQLLGLSYEAFLQAVVLPQGEFARFLQSDAGERRKLLRDLLRLRVYERMRERATKARDRLKLETDAAQARLDSDLLGATEEGVQALKLERSGLGEKITAARDAVAVQAAALEETVTRHKSTKALGAARSRLAEISRQDAQMRALQSRLDADRKAAPLLPVLDQLATLRQAAESARVKASDAETAAGNLDEQVAAASKALTRAKEAEGELPALQGQIDALNEAITLAAPLGSVRERHKADEEAAREATRERKAVESAAEKAETALEAATKSKLIASKALGKIAYDKPRATRLRRAQKDALSLRAHRESLGDEKREAETQQEKAESAEKAATAAAKKAEESRESASKLEEQLAKLRTEIRDGEKRGHAAILRVGLKAGDECPVCEQEVKKTPPRISAPEIERLEEREQLLAKKTSDADSEASKLEKKSADLTGKAEGVREAADAAEKKRERSAEKTKLLDEALRKAVGLDVSAAGGVVIEERLLAALEALEADQEAHEAAQEALEEAERGLVKAENASETAKGRVAGAKKEEKASEQRAAATKAELEELQQRMAKLTKAPDPIAARTELVRRSAAIAKAVVDTAAVVSARGKEAAGARASAEGAHAESGKAAEALVKCENGSRAAILEAGFADEPAVRAAALSAANSGQYRKQVETHATDRASALSRIEELERELSGREVDDAGLAAARSALATLAETHQSLVAAVASLGTRIGELEKKVAIASQLRVDLERTRATLNLQTRLSADLSGGKLESFVLEEVSRELCGGASRRLTELSSARYTLTFTDETFHVQDHDNAGERRRADTLSGGETFLASLALALELSEQVTKAAGAIPLDSLFIDEGFGSLDPETLDTVTGAIESLPVGGRMVGIITHIRDLTERLPARIELRKGANGSHVTVTHHSGE